jgi:glycosyltransferase involved in cell wall biosynthesis
MSSRRYFVIDPGFEDFDSHHGVVADALKRKAELLTKDILVLASNKIELVSEDQEGKIIPFFSTPCYTNNLKPLPADRENTLAENFMGELKKLIHNYDVSHQDVLVMHTGFSHLFLGLAQFFASIERQASPKLILCGMFDPGSQKLESADDVLRFSWFCKNKLSLSFLRQSVSPENIVFATSCNEYKFGYQELIGCQFQIHPAINYQPLTNDNCYIEERKRLLLYVGSIKRDKGLDFILQNISLLLSEFNNIDFIFHWNTNSPGIRDFTDVKTILTELSNRFGNLELMYGTLEKAEYERLFNSIQGVVASYAPSDYKHKTSGVFWDALRRDKCSLLCSNGTWLARESLALGESAYFFDYEDIASMIRAISVWESRELSGVDNNNPYKKMICKPFSDWIFSQFL